MAVAVRGASPGAGHPGAVAAATSAGRSDAAAGPRPSPRPRAETIAVIGDVHGNLPALRAVLSDIDRRGIRRVWCVGDLVGFGASPQEVIDLLRERGAQCLLGNIDEKTLEVGPRRPARDPAKRTRQQTLHWTYRRLLPSGREYLRSLPREIRLELGGRKLLLVHGSPESIDEYIQEETSEGRLRELARAGGADVIVAGHAHEPLVKRVDGALFVNTGSVGRPEAGGGRSCYALLTVGPRSVRARHIRPRYDIAAAVEAVRAAGLPETYATMILTGRKFQDALRMETEAAVRGLAPEAVLRRAHALARRCRHQRNHALHVTRLALGILDPLAGSLRLGGRERLLLECAGILHDIGWAHGQKGHHKESMRMILAAPDLGLSGRERAVVANVARYHRRALPAPRHDEYRRLAAADRKLVRMLGGILRLADGLDRRHRGCVQGVTCRREGRRLVVACRAAGPALPEREAAEEKKDLLAAAIGGPVVLEWPGRELTRP